MQEDRTSEAQLTKEISEDINKILVATIQVPNGEGRKEGEEEKEEKVVGCVAVKPFAEGELEVGMLSVQPNMQSSGIGSKLMNAAIELMKKEFNAKRAVVLTISVREDVLGWYKRLGFKETGEYKPLYPHMRPTVDCHFVISKKDI